MNRSNFILQYLERNTYEKVEDNESDIGDSSNINGCHIDGGNESESNINNSC